MEMVGNEQVKISENVHTPGWDSLANHIIIQAVNDLACKYAGVRVKRCSKDESQTRLVNDAERFLHSQWCETLTDVKSDVLIEAAKRKGVIMRFEIDHHCTKCNKYLNRCPHHIMESLSNEQKMLEANAVRDEERKRGELLCRKEM